MCISTTSLEWIDFSFFCHFWYRRAMGLHQAVALCMDHCDAAELTNDNAWFKTIILSGGTTCLPGLAGMYSLISCGKDKTGELDISDPVG